MNMDCTGCKYENQPSTAYPCNQCIRNPNDIFDEYVPKEEGEEDSQCEK